MMLHYRYFLTVMAAALAFFSLSACSAPSETPSDGAGYLTLYLVRHAEKEVGPDPLLTPEGEARAERLAGLMKRVGVSEVWSSDTRRTRNTAAPSANAFGLETQIYDAGDLPGTADMLKGRTGVVLVVGHSNTTPALAGFLTGRDEGGEFDERNYDLLYRVEIDPDGYSVAYLMSYDALEESVS